MTEQEPKKDQYSEVNIPPTKKKTKKKKQD